MEYKVIDTIFCLSIVVDYDIELFQRVGFEKLTYYLHNLNLTAEE